MRVYIVAIESSSPNHQESSKDLTDTTREIEFTFPKEMRDRIAAVRMQAAKPMYNCTLKFGKNYIAREDQLGDLRKAAGEGDRKMREIDNRLHCQLVMFPIDMDEVRQGETYQMVLNAIRYNVYNTVFARLAETLASKKGMTDATRRSLLKMVENLRAINVLEDKDIELQLDAFKARIESSMLKELQDEINNALLNMDKRGAQIIT
jgi:hypothetical protein